MKNRTKAFLVSIIIGVILLYYNYSKFGITNVFQAFKNFTPGVFLIYGSAIALFGFTPNFYTTFIIMGGGAFSYSFPVPMALGVLKTAQVSALGILNLNKAIGLSISILIRLKDVIRTLIGGLSLFYYGMSFGLIWKQIRERKNAKQTK